VQLCRSITRQVSSSLRSALRMLQPTYWSGEYNCSNLRICAMLRSGNVSRMISPDANTSTLVASVMTLAACVMMSRYELCQAIEQSSKQDIYIRNECTALYANHERARRTQPFQEELPACQPNQQ